MARVDAPSRFLFRISKIGKTVSDADKMEMVLSASNLDWYAARPVRLVDGPVSWRMGVLERAKISDATVRADLAEWVLDAVDQEAPFETRAELVGLR